MKGREGFSELLGGAYVEDLRDIVSEWAEAHPDFKAYVERCLCPAVGEVDFGRKLTRAVNRETKEFFSRHEVRVATDWSNVYYDLVKPWSENAASLSTEKLFDLVNVIVTEVGMQVTDEDFYGDDCYGDDFSGNIIDIMGVLSNLSGLLLVREDLEPETLAAFKELVLTAQKYDVMAGYIGSPYGFILDLIKLREEAGEVTCELYDDLIGYNPGREAGAWVCRKIDFIRSMGLSCEAQEYMESEIRHPEVCLKYYQELLGAGNWQDAIKLLDKAQAIKGDTQNYFSYNAPDWLELKQQLLDEHGTAEDRVENLKRLFYNSYNDKSKYYHQLKELVGTDGWKAFYHDLLSNVRCCNALDEVAPFLMEEGEHDWLLRLVSEAEKRDATNYRTPLRYAGALRPTHFDEMQAALVRTVRAYAADRYAPKKPVKSSHYSYFRADLESLSELGYSGVQKELVTFLLQEYRFRPSLARELRAIKLD